MYYCVSRCGFSCKSPTWILIGFSFAFANAITAGMISVIPGEVLRPEISCSGTGFAAAMSRIGAAIGVF